MGRVPCLHASLQKAAPSCAVRLHTSYGSFLVVGCCMSSYQQHPCLPCCRRTPCDTWPPSAHSQPTRLAHSCPLRVTMEFDSEVTQQAPIAAHVFQVRHSHCAAAAWTRGAPSPSPTPPAVQSFSAGREQIAGCGGGGLGELEQCRRGAWDVPAYHSTLWATSRCGH